MNPTFSRRDFQASVAAAAISGCLASQPLEASETEFQLNYLLGSCMYGYLYVGEIFPEVKKTGATAIDIWPKVHGNQREQLDGLGEEKFAQMLKDHGISLGCITQYKLGPFGLQDEMRLAHRLGCHTMVTGGRGPKGVTGNELKTEVGKFVEAMKPHLDVAAENGVTVAIENHGNNNALGNLPVPRKSTS